LSWRGSNLASQIADKHFGNATFTATVEDVLGTDAACQIVSGCANSDCWTYTLGDLKLDSDLFQSCVFNGVQSKGCFMPRNQIPASPDDAALHRCHGHSKCETEREHMKRPLISVLFLLATATFASAKNKVAFLNVTSPDFHIEVIPDSAPTGDYLDKTKYCVASLASNLPGGE
jgi:hypothetical protein